MRSCALSDDCRHLLAVVGNGFIFRFEYAWPGPKGQAVAEAAGRVAAAQELSAAALARGPGQGLEAAAVVAQVRYSMLTHRMLGWMGLAEQGMWGGA